MIFQTPKIFKRLFHFLSRQAVEVEGTVELTSAAKPAAAEVVLVQQQQHQLQGGREFRNLSSYFRFRPGSVKT